jgi:beta-lactam-binding protein with PASTA domain
MTRSRKPRGKVIAQSPRAGATLVVGTPVRLTVSRGRR